MSSSKSSRRLSNIPIRIPKISVDPPREGRASAASVPVEHAAEGAEIDSKLESNNHSPAPSGGHLRRRLSQIVIPKRISSLWTNSKDIGTQKPAVQRKPAPPPPNYPPPSYPPTASQDHPPRAVPSNSLPYESTSLMASHHTQLPSRPVPKSHHTPSVPGEYRQPSQTMTTPTFPPPHRVISNDSLGNAVTHSHINQMGQQPSAEDTPRGRASSISYGTWLPPIPKSTPMMGPPAVPASDPLQPLDQAPSGPSHLVKARPKQTLDSASQVPHKHKSTRSTSQPSPQSGTRLHKSTPSQSSLNPSASHSPAASPTNSPMLRGRDRSHSLAPPPSFNDVGGSNRIVSSPASGGSRPISYHSDQSGGSPEGRLSKRRSWLPGVRSRASSKSELSKDGPSAWVRSGSNKMPYNIQLLLNGDKVPELWDDNADTYVYLFPPSSNKGPSFRVPSLTISSSALLMKLAFGNGSQVAGLRQRTRSFDGRNSLTSDDATRNLHTRGPNTPPYTPPIKPRDNTSDGSGESVSTLGEIPREGHLYFPFDALVVERSRTDGNDAGKNNVETVPMAFSSDLDRLVAIRNLFSFLTGQPLVATRNNYSTFSILCNIGSTLNCLKFTNVDGSTYGEAAAASLGFYIDDLNLADVRNSREATLEGIVLGERMRSVDLYNEAFTHGVGKYEAIRGHNDAWGMISETTRNRMERAYLDLEQRKKSINVRLTHCEFPSLFAGIASSTTSEESKVVNFKAWKSSFMSMRKFVLSYYKDLHGSWPPKASSKKNNFSETGFNRLVLKGLYSDFCTLYDLLVDRESLTTRSMEQNGVVPDGLADDIFAEALRKVLNEYDRSYPPVQPPVPFDLPKVPTMATLDAKHSSYSPSVQQEASARKLKDYETVLLLTKAHNLDSDIQTPFLKSFRTFEQNYARNKSAQELADMRHGHWLFVYVILQALPMIVQDAPGIRHTQGVEYFLCQPPLGGVPWVDASVSMAWYGVEGGGAIALPSDVVEHGVEGVYRRSHCWIAASKWLTALHGPEDLTMEPTDGPGAIGDGMMSPLEEPAPPFATDQGLRSPQSPFDSFSTYGSVASARNSGLGTPPLPRDTLSPMTQQDRRRSRSASTHRRSIAIGLEQLPVPRGFEMSRVSPPLTGGPSGGYLSPESNDSVNAPGREPSPVGEGWGIRRASGQAGQAGTSSQGKQTFEEILSGMGGDEKDNKKRGRRSFIGF